MTEERWPAGWFERLMLHRKLNEQEYAEYAECYRSIGAEPNQELREVAAQDGDVDARP